jgi:hypothetical protein
MEKGRKKRENEQSREGRRAPNIAPPRDCIGKHNNNNTKGCFRHEEGMVEYRTKVCLLGMETDIHIVVRSNRSR